MSKLDSDEKRINECKIDQKTISILSQSKKSDKNGKQESVWDVGHPVKKSTYTLCRSLEKQRGEGQKRCLRIKNKQNTQTMKDIKPQI